MDERYFFDKRNIKRGTKKYGIMMLICLPILIGVNYLLGDLATGWVIFIDVVLALFVIIVLDLIVSKIQARKELKQRQLEEDERLKKRVQARTPKKENIAVKPKKRKRRNRGNKQDSLQTDETNNG